MEKSETDTKAKRWRMLKNIAVMTVAFVFLYSAVIGLFLLQSSLNAEMGVISLGANFAATAFSCIFLSTIVVQKLGCKWSLVISMIGLTLWMSANLYASWPTLVIGALLMGLAWSVLWTAHCTYFTLSGIEYAQLTNQLPDVVLSKFFGIFFMLFMSGPIWGNILSSTILSMSSNNDVISNNITIPPSFEHCGANDCGLIVQGNDTNVDSQRPEQWVVWTLVGTYVVFGVISIIVLAVFMDPEPAEQKEKNKAIKFSASLFTATISQMGNKYQVLLAPLTIYTGMEQAFMTAEYTKSYIACSIGIASIGKVVIAYCASAAAVSVLSGIVVKKLGRPPVFVTAFVAHVICLCIFLFWVPNPNKLWIMFLMPAVWGIGDAIWQTQINALYSLLFRDNSEAAFSNYRLWEAVGMIASFSYSSFICISLKIYILLTVLVIGVVCFLLVEVILKRESRTVNLAENEKALALRDDRLYPVTEVVRHKSPVYVPKYSTDKAAEIIRLKSVSQDGTEGQSEQYFRRLSVFVPVLDEEHNK